MRMIGRARARILIRRAAAWWAAQQPLRRGGWLVVLAATVGLPVASVALAGSAGSDEPADVEIRPIRRLIATTAQSAAPLVVVGETSTSEPTPEVPEAVTSIEQLTEEYGEPSGTTLGRLRIPTLGVDAPIGVRAVGTDGAMPNPAGPSDVVWYDFGAWASYGGAIGAGANAIFSGHVDYADTVPWAGVDFRGRGVFFSLTLLSPGDVIDIEVDGEELRYAVQWRRPVEASDAGAWGEVLSADVEQDSITLITCGGTFNTAARAYLDRTVVRAVRL